MNELQSGDGELRRDVETSEGLVVGALMPTLFVRRKHARLPPSLIFLYLSYTSNPVNNYISQAVFVKSILFRIIFRSSAGTFAEDIRLAVSISRHVTCIYISTYRISRPAGNRSANRELEVCAHVLITDFPFHSDHTQIRRLSSMRED